MTTESREMTAVGEGFPSETQRLNSFSTAAETISRNLRLDAEIAVEVRQTLTELAELGQPGVPFICAETDSRGRPEIKSAGTLVEPLGIKQLQYIDNPHLHIRGAWNDMADRRITYSWEYDLRYILGVDPEAKTVRVRKLVLGDATEKWLREHSPGVVTASDPDIRRMSQFVNSVRAAGFPPDFLNLSDEERAAVTVQLRNAFLEARHTSGDRKQLLKNMAYINGAVSPKMYATYYERFLAHMAERMPNPFEAPLPASWRLAALNLGALLPYRYTRPEGQLVTHPDALVHAVIADWHTIRARQIERKTRPTVTATLRPGFFTEEVHHTPELDNGD